jgi:hypothetical protein
MTNTFIFAMWAILADEGIMAKYYSIKELAKELVCSV